ncbi:PLAC8-domain-containing protein [Phellopilus nigrolimitatus]|nr:PLAC8-domain-containing protein [Phellopilus nigrolimitatus]
MDLRNAGGVPKRQNGERDWSFGFCDCFGDFGTCCLGCLCPCIVYSQVKTRLSHLERTGQHHPEGGDSFASDCFVHGLLDCCGMGWVLQIGSRSSIRDRYRIGGNGCADCLAAWCCTPCELTQESREIELEERALMGAGRVPIPYASPMNTGYAKP